MREVVQQPLHLCVLRLLQVSQQCDASRLFLRSIVCLARAALSFEPTRNTLLQVNKQTCNVQMYIWRRVSVVGLANAKQVAPVELRVGVVGVDFLRHPVTQLQLLEVLRACVG